MHAFDAEVKAWRFPEVLRITRQWVSECLILKDSVFPQYLLFITLAHNAADRIYRAFADSAPGQPRLRPILMPYDTLGSSRNVDFDTRRAVYATRPDRCHVSHIVLDSNWEAKLAQALEEMDEVFAYVKNQQLGFAIPYSVNGEPHSYLPDYIVRIDDGRGPDDPLNLVLEVTGEKKKDKEAKVETAQRLWVPAVNNEESFGRWAFFEIRDPWNAQTEIRTWLRRASRPSA